MAEEKKESIFDKIWDVFASVKLAVVIFALIAATSVVGTIIEQAGRSGKKHQGPFEEVRF